MNIAQYHTCKDMVALVLLALSVRAPVGRHEEDGAAFSTDDVLNVLRSLPKVQGRAKRWEASTVRSILRKSGKGYWFRRDGKDWDDLAPSEKGWVFDHCVVPVAEYRLMVEIVKAANFFGIEDTSGGECAEYLASLPRGLAKLEKLEAWARLQK
jgi:hypothetical protein